ncbi:ribosomal protein S18 acetylase RimI-like enzyme [Sphingobium sp. OAS761]|uniref:GNAT family N-acetyltransferase n=1 Tax=Sphingobium sp. OAS761 TaxID=2817901 RepID=UPI00209D153B|nr:GNAT family N-acetyltransferase [Sphingobium sp. OAS761]MCP1468952.1 ribosomal protein S18 acetylase RimI-like enzyme [Sphingobium sp. OAS761]
MTPIRWRHAEAKDARALSILGGATFLASFAHDHPGAALIDHIRGAHGEAYYEAALAEPETSILIGETPMGAPVGYAMLTRPDLPVAIDAGSDVELKRIYLLHGWQGSGHGDEIIARILGEARERGARRLLLAVYPQNDRARRFYARHGFSHIGELTFMVGDVPFRDLIYARPL